MGSARASSNLVGVDIVFSLLREKTQKVSTSQRFELWRAEPNRFLIYLLNHSDTMSELIQLLHRVIKWVIGLVV